MLSTTNNTFWHDLQLPISINLKSVLYLWYILCMPVMAVNNDIMTAKISTMPWLPKMQHSKLLTLRWRWFWGCGRDYVAVVFASKGFQYLQNGCLQPTWWKITQDAKQKNVDAPLTLILRIERCPCCRLFGQCNQPICLSCITATRSLLNYSPYTTTNRWYSVHTQFDKWAVDMSLAPFQVKTTNMLVMHIREYIPFR